MIAGMVLYNPLIGDLKKNLDALTNQIDQLILIDNGSDNLLEIKEMVKKITCESYKKVDIQILENKKNLGIAKALNQICEIAENNQKKFVLLLDQDTLLEKSYVEEMSKAISRNQLNKIAIYTPRILDADNTEVEYDYKVDQINYDIMVDKCITSGSIIDVKFWCENGKFDEDLFIDGVDHEYCLRVNQKKFNILKVYNAKIYHKIGESVKFNFFLFNFFVFHHTYTRKYYIVRNIILINKKYNRNARSFLSVSKQFFTVILFEKQKLTKVKYMSRGVIDGIKNKKGKLHI